MNAGSGYSAALAALALSVALSGCTTPADDAANSVTSSATTAIPSQATRPPRATTTTRSIPVPVEISCGTGPFDAMVTTVSAEGETACTTALAVLDAYATRARTLGADTVVTIAVGTGVWDCRAYDAASPHQECVDKDNPAEAIHSGP